MSRYRGVLSGPKFSGRGHTTFLDAAYPVLMAAKDAEEVKRIVVSVICSGKGSGTVSYTHLTLPTIYSV